MARDEHRILPEDSVPLVSPRVRPVSDFDDAVSRFEEHVSREPSPILEEYHASSASGASQQDDAAYRGQAFMEYDQSYAGHMQGEGLDVSAHPHLGQHMQEEWTPNVMSPEDHTSDPFSDRMGAAHSPYGVSPIGMGRPAVANPSPPYEHDVTSGHHYDRQEAASTGYSSYDYDPERYAPETSPYKLYSHPHNSIPRSRSPTPLETPPRASRWPQFGLTRRVLSTNKENSAPLANLPKLSRKPVSYGVESEPRSSRAIEEASPLVDSTTMHFGLPPRKQRRRNQAAKKLIPLTHGNFVVDLEVPPNIVMPEKNLRESLSVRYTGVTCDPDEFMDKNYFLRQNMSGRDTEIAIAITLYNEDEVLLCRTLYGVMRNIQELGKRKNSRIWGKNAWKKIVVVIIADGRKSVSPRVLDCLSILGVYQAGSHMNNKILGEDVTAHLFEYTTTMALDPSISFQLASPMQVIFCLKEKNTKKINSHRWFFSAFCRLLQPNVCVLLDVGTRPSPKSIYQMWKTFDLNSNVGGACGEIAVYKGKWWRGLLNPLVAAQNFEYKMSNILDKPLESMLGYITVLPGAFSAYRFIALQNDSNGVGPLASYFKGEIVDGNQHDIFTRNMYLAEDRILCFELVAKHDHDYVLRYVKNAVAETDVPNALPEFISQRRRWLNGSLFASLYAVAHFGQVLRSDHSTWRKVFLVSEEAYNVIMLAFGWFSIGNLYCFYTILTSSLADPAIGKEALRYVNGGVQYLFAGAIAACFIFSMGNKPRASKWKYKSTSIFFGLLSAYMIAASVICSIHIARSSNEHGALFTQMKLSIIATVGCWVASSFLAGDPWHIFTSGLAYLLLSPTYIIILNTFAFGNLDDISWGTKQQTSDINDLGAVSAANQASRANVVEVELPPDAAEESSEAHYAEALNNLRTRKPIQEYTGDFHAEQVAAAKDYYANIRTNVLLAWVLSNGVLVVGILGAGNSSATFSSGHEGAVTRTYMTVILVFVAMTSIYRFAGSTLFLIVRLFTG